MGFIYQINKVTTINMSSIVQNTPENKKKSTVNYVDSFSKNKVSIPNYRLISNEFIKVPRSQDPNFKFTSVSKDIKIKTCKLPELRPDQKITVENVFKNLDTFLDSIIVRPTAYGKTILSLAISNRLKKKTLIVVNRSELVKQWVSEIKKFFPYNTVGTIQGTAFDIHCDFIVGTVQTIALKKNITVDSLKDIGLCVIDEIHTIPSERFIETLFKVSSDMRLGMTATLKRSSDDLHQILLQHLPVLDSLETQKTQKTIVKFIDSGYYQRILYNNSSKMNYSEMLNLVASNTERNKMISEVILKELQISSSKRILVVSDRISQLVVLNELLGNEISGLLTGKNKDPEISNKRVILGSSGVVSTGMNIKTLNCLLLASAKANVVQTIGRIFRQNHSLFPVIIDIYDNGSIAKSQLKKRIQQYKSEIRDIEFIGLPGTMPSTSVPVEFLD
jgi:superfamily II DNA or RNA helicase